MTGHAMKRMGSSIFADGMTAIIQSSLCSYNLHAEKRWKHSRSSKAIWNAKHFSASLRRGERINKQVLPVRLAHIKTPILHAKSIGRMGRFNVLSGAVDEEQIIVEFVELVGKLSEDKFKLWPET